MNRLGAIVAEAGEDFDDNAPQSAAEAQADAETDWMNRLLDRVTARIEREGREELDFDRIYHEERERLRRARWDEARQSSISSARRTSGPMRRTWGFWCLRHRVRNWPSRAMRHL